MMTRWTETTPLGQVTLFWKQDALVGLDLSPVGEYRGTVEAQLDKYLPAPAAKLEQTEGDRQFFNWLAGYLAGGKDACPIKLELYGSEFQIKVWNQLRQIPRGEVWTYAQLAHAIGTKGVRAVGTAVGRNPIPIVIPCHRVVRQDGTLGQFSAGEGTATKRLLLQREGVDQALLDQMEAE